MYVYLKKCDHMQAWRKKVCNDHLNKQLYKAY